MGSQKCGTAHTQQPWHCGELVRNVDPKLEPARLGRLATLEGGELGS